LILYKIITEVAILSLLHASIPSHWIPIVAIGRAEEWPKRKVLLIAAFAAFAHTLSTLVLATIFLLVGNEINKLMSTENLTEWIAPILLILLGLYYLFSWKKSHNHRHEHVLPEEVRKSSFVTILLIALTMFLSPCLELIVYFIEPAKHGLFTVLIASLSYIVFTVTAIVILVWISFSGLEFVNTEFLHKYGKLLTGAVLLIAGILSFWGDLHLH
jgi:putative Mn2+ efflux pump MntP